MTKIDVIVPCYNEEKNLPRLNDKLLELSNLAAAKNDLINVIYVNDCSTDKTREVLENQTVDFSFEVINHKVNKNLGGALKSGFQLSSAPIIMTIDADLTYNPIDLYNKKSKLDKFDILSGTGLLSWSFYFAPIAFRRKIFSLATPFLYNIALRRLFLTYTSLFRMYKSTSIKSLEIKANDFTALAEIFSSCILNKCKIYEFGALYNPPKGRVSSMNVSLTIKAHLQLLKRLVKK